MIDKAKLNAAFKALRKYGFIARQNFKCCGNCSGTAIGIEYGKLSPRKRDNVLGAVSYHAQDAAGMRKGEDLYLQFGQIEHCKYATPHPTEWVGKKVVRILQEWGLDVDWDGNPMTRIIILADPPKKEAKNGEEAYLVASGGKL